MKKTGLAFLYCIGLFFMSACLPNKVGKSRMQKDQGQFQKNDKKGPDTTVPDSGPGSPGEDALDSTFTFGLAGSLVSPSENPSPTIVVTGVHPGYRVGLFLDDRCSLGISRRVEASESSVRITTYHLDGNEQGGTNRAYTLHAREFFANGDPAGECSSTSITYERLPRDDNNPPVSLPNRPSGLSLIDPVTSSSTDDTPTILISGVTPNSSVTLYSDENCSQEIGPSIFSSGSSVSITTNPLPLLDREYNIYARASLGGQFSACSSASVTYERISLNDSSPISPPNPPSELILENPTTSPNTSDTPTIFVSGVTVNSSVILYSDENCSQAISDAKTSSGNSISITTRPLLDLKSEYKIHAKVFLEGLSSVCSIANVSYIKILPNNIDPKVNEFVTAWNLSNDDKKITLPLPTGNFNYNFRVDWGDGVVEDIAFSGSSDFSPISHDYSSAGEKIIKISGALEAWSFNNSGDKLKLTKVLNLGKVGWKDFSNAFYGCLNMTQFTAGYTDTSSVANMSGMFHGNYNLTGHLDLSSFDTKQVHNMASMFKHARISTIDLSRFDTSSVTNMKRMFMDMQRLITLDLSTFNTSNVTNMSEMFRIHTAFHDESFSKLETLDLNHLNVENVTDMSYMFAKLGSLKNLYISNFDTKSATDMSYMFFGLLNLYTLELTKFNTQNVENMRSMFLASRKLRELKLGHFNTSKVRNMSFMFRDTKNLRRLLIGNFDTSNVTSMVYMFAETKLNSIDLKHFNTKNVSNMSNMFLGNSKLTNINLQNFDVRNLADATFIFRGVGSLGTNTDILVQGWKGVSLFEKKVEEMYRKLGLSSVDMRMHLGLNKTESYIEIHCNLPLIRVPMISCFNSSNYPENFPSL